MVNPLFSPGRPPGAPSCSAAAPASVAGSHVSPSCTGVTARWRRWQPTRLTPVSPEFSGQTRKYRQTRLELGGRPFQCQLGGGGLIQTPLSLLIWVERRGSASVIATS